MPEIDQIIAAEELIEELNERGEANDVSLRSLIETMHLRGLRFAQGSHADTIKALDKIDEASE